MKFNNKTFIFLLILFAFFLSCELFDNESEEINIPDPITVGEATKSYTGVDERIWVYFERFEEAAAERGIQVDLQAANVTAEIVASQNSPGLCTQDTNGTLHHITITDAYWDNADVTKKEIMVFHELGHCHLGRLHLDLAFPNGTCVSLMRTGSGSCNDNYNVETRKDYLDELFGL